MKIQLNQTYKNLRGEEIKNEEGLLTLGQVLANLVLLPNEGKKGFRPLPAYELAKKFYSEPEVDLGLSDFVQLKELIETNNAYMILVTAQTLEMLENAKLQEEIKKK